MVFLFLLTEEDAVFVRPKSVQIQISLDFYLFVFIEDFFFTDSKPDQTRAQKPGVTGRATMTSHYWTNESRTRFYF